MHNNNDNGQNSVATSAPSSNQFAYQITDARKNSQGKYSVADLTWDNLKAVINKTKRTRHKLCVIIFPNRAGVQTTNLTNGFGVSHWVFYDGIAGKFSPNSNLWVESLPITASTEQICRTIFRECTGFAHLAGLNIEGNSDFLYK